MTEQERYFDEVGGEVVLHHVDTYRKKTIKTWRRRIGCNQDAKSCVFLIDKEVCTASYQRENGKIVNFNPRNPHVFCAKVRPVW